MAKKSNKFLTIKGKFKGVPPDTDLPPGDYVYQKTTPALANAESLHGERMQIRRNLPQYNPNTPAQQVNRALFALGVAAYKLMSPEEKAEWKEIGLRKNINAFQAFMSNYMKMAKGR